MREDGKNKEYIFGSHSFRHGAFNPETSVPLSDLRIDQRPTQVDLQAIGKELFWSGTAVERNRVRNNQNALNNEPLWLDTSVEDSWIMNEMTWILPVIPGACIIDGAKNAPQASEAADMESQIAILRKLVKSSGIYALSSVASPLVSLVLAPFLTHQLSVSDYGILAITNTAIGLGVGITQLGLASAFFRAYGYDYSSERDRRDVVATTTTLLCLISMLVAIAAATLAPELAKLLLGHSSLSYYISLVGGVILLQNLTVPGMAWLRAESRPLPYSLLSIGNLVATLLATLFLVGVLHWGITGAIIANGIGCGCIVICTVPIIVVRVGIKLRVDVAQNLLAFGLPLVLSFVSYWVLQLSDRYLLSLFASLAETARYTVAYTLGGAMSVVIIGPFVLAWPAMMFSIAKRKDAVHVFKLVFRWFGLFLLFAAFGFSLVATCILDWFFPVAYHSMAPVIPVVAESIVFYGVYFVFMSGANIQRKTWLAAVFTTIAAVVNVAINLVLIPLYGAMGAAASTLLAYIVLALVAYIANQRLYPVPFEIGRFTIGLLVGVALYIGASFLGQAQETYITWGGYMGTLALYGGCLIVLGKLPFRRI